MHVLLSKKDTSQKREKEMRIVFTPPSEEEFKQLFLSVPLRKGGGVEDISVFQPHLPYSQRYNRKGAEFFSFISGIAKRVLPFLFKAAKPAAKEFGSAIVNDVIKGNVPIKQSLKKHGIKALKDTSLRLFKGSGRITKRKKRGVKKRKKKIKKKCIRKNKKKTRTEYKSDIFFLI